MWPFKKKKIYKIDWFFITDISINTTLVKAYDEAHAWQYVQNLYSIPVSLVKIEEFKGDN